MYLLSLENIRNKGERPMGLKNYLEYCLSKEGAYPDFPFGELPVVMKVEGRIFAELYDREIKPQITLKCEPVLAVLLREKYPGLVVPGYHVPDRNKKYWNTIRLDNTEVPEREVFDMIDHSYREVVKKLKKKKGSPDSTAV